MMLRDILAARLRELMAQRPDLDTQAKLAKRAGISQSSVGRILKCEVHTALDVLESIGTAFGLHPLALITDPRESGIADAMAVGYQERELLRAWRLLAPPQQHAVMGYINVATMRATGVLNDSETFGNGSKPGAQSTPVFVEGALPSAAKAALARAAARPPSDDFEQSLDAHEHNRTTREAPGKRRRGG